MYSLTLILSAVFNALLRSKKSSRVNWAMLALWGFVAISFAAFFFAGYFIWIKCHDR